ncbi:PEN family class A beta-lactamase, Bpc-type [Burkholderia thailandensis]|uniref:PEN family class A beta-lactamase, Bpc-type n=1 Tax=Burkholderia thailandensis TaxID=57975 RepID=UPI0003EC75CF|nr:PEN family class A beta-lactamase, Bpc-type [Burkholderia thailandensis]AHI66983.1 beta-lactamase Toho-1 [Burkholderia thailandensis H0587]AOI54635.1 class A beta-lactamase [Burkholderia thailandensis]AOJ53995.1 class A beta-lactamase [Burkholderia thailandensis]AVR27862.1 PenI family class A extended-spectrum beta-lactamase [Burkholderia thailandensis]MCS3393064.1 PenI family extended-spectrum class A beta-lactamase [Burkholderia thailandensis]
MNHSPLRRSLLIAAVSAPLVGACAPLRDNSRNVAAEQQLRELESTFDGRLGFVALDTATGARIAHRADERFPFCSTFKTMLSAAVLARSAGDAALLQRRIPYAKRDLVRYSPITEKHVGAGMTVAELCAATLQYSDNTAANLLIALLGGPQAVTAYARSIGDATFRLDRRETELNTAIPGDERDTTTPAAMAASVRRLLVGDALDTAQRAQLNAWMLGNKTGDARIRAGVPAGWRVADKTGTGDYGTGNDIGVAYPPDRAPIVFVVYTTMRSRNAQARDDVIASAARIAARAFV